MRERVKGLLPAFIRTPVSSLWQRLYWWNANRVSPRRGRRVARRLVDAGRPIRLEIGSGPRAGMEEWVSLDLNVGAHIQHDLNRPLPFPDGSVDEIYSSHVLEHFGYPDPLLAILRECHRVLKPGGRIRAAVPNARLYLEGYFRPAEFDRERYCSYEVGLKHDRAIDIVNFIAYLGGGHKTLFDAESFPKVLADAGFREATTRDFDQSVDLERRRHESVYAQAIK
jgi:predicted SAM-dependent methyltransferase